jgi:hypothetical protein
MHGELAMTRRNRPEEALQRTVASYLDLALPRDAVWFHPPNGGARSKAEAGIFKAMGVKRGVPDLIIIYRGRVVAIELKAPGGTRSPAQKLMHAQLSAAGALVYTATSIEEVESFLRVAFIPLKATTGARAA